MEGGGCGLAAGSIFRFVLAVALAVALAGGRWHSNKQVSMPVQASANGIGKEGGGGVEGGTENREGLRKAVSA